MSDPVEQSYPSGWVEAFLPEICQPKQWKTISTKALTDDGYVVYGANGIIGKYSTYTHENPTLMITCRGATCGNLHISVPFAYINGNAMALDGLPEDLVKLEYLHYALKSRGFVDAISGSAQPQITGQGLSVVNVPIAPIAEQREIARRLDELLAQVDTLKTRLDAIPSILKRFRQSTLAAATSGKLTEQWREENANSFETGEELLRRARLARRNNWEETELAKYESKGKKPPKNWKLRFKESAEINSGDHPNLPDSWSWGRIEELCSEIVDCPHSTPKWTPNGAACVRTSEFRPGALDLSHVRYVSQDTYQSRVQRLVPKSGDILFSREGGILGIACRIPTGANICLGQRMMLMRSNTDWLLGQILMNYLNSPPVQGWIKNNTGGSASPHINVGDVKRLHIPVCSIEEQAEIVRRVEELFAFADQVEQRVNDAQARVNHLTQSILAKAFRGELTESWRANHPDLITGENSAEALLKRIKTERANLTPKKKTRRKK